MTQKQKLKFFFSLEKSHFSFIRPKLDFCFFMSSSSHRRRVVIASSSLRRRVVIASSSLRPRVVLASSLYRCCIVSSTTLLVLITQSFLLVETCAIPLRKALNKGFISSVTPKTSDQVMGTLWPKNWKFHGYIGVALSLFVLITRSIFDLETCAIPLCKALTKGSISSMTPKTSDQVMGTLWP